MRWSRALILPVLLMLILAACGGASSSSGGNGNGGSSQAAEESQGSEPSQADEESQAPAESQGSGQSAGDLDALIEALTPPNSSEVTRTTAQGGAYIGWNSTDNPDSLKGFYESAIPGTGMVILTTSSTQGSYIWIFAENDSSSYGGSITVAPQTDGTDGSYVILAATTE